MGLLPSGAYMEARSLRFEDVNLPTLRVSELRKIRGRDVSIIVQNPLAALNPMKQIGDQLADANRAHVPRADRRDVEEHILESLAMVGIPDLRRRAGHMHIS